MRDEVDANEESARIASTCGIEVNAVFEFGHGFSAVLDIVQLGCVRCDEAVTAVIPNAPPVPDGAAERGRSASVPPVRATPPTLARITVTQADITRLGVDAIVNAANERMLGGGGVDGAIHRAAGPRLLEACLLLPEVRPGVRCPTGEARITPGFDLAAKFVIHTVGPVWRGGGAVEDDLLASCYRSSLALADRHSIRSLAFPAISCGVFGYPVESAAAIAVDTLRRHASEASPHVTLVAFDATMRAILERAVDGAKGPAT